MIDATGSTARDSYADLNDAIGPFDGQIVRLQCIQAAIAATPTYEPGGQLAEIMLTARRFARFVFDGTTPGLQLKVKPAGAPSAMVQPE